MISHQNRCSFCLRSRADAASAREKRHVLSSAATTSALASPGQVTQELMFEEVYRGSPRAQSKTVQETQAVDWYRRRPHHMPKDSDFHRENNRCGGGSLDQGTALTDETRTNPTF
ncbi:Hypothetical predicted protein [Marmota monax]|uniref:Uncharacterized protein n=1 Tax=Marmota monax TaxID=9995 RepID=A0A5E4A2S1_MARMO|nr:Hypothetical predicted protein [Marmota monax]